MADEEIAVEYRRDGDHGHHVALGSAALADIHIDYTGMSRDQRAGTATRLLCASALYCFAGTLGSALTNRGARVRSMTGRAVAEKGRDFHGRTKVTKIAITVDVDVDPEDRGILDKCKLLMQNGCLVTYSLDEGIFVEYEINEAG